MIQAPAEAAEKDRQYATTLANGIDILSSFKAGERSLGNKDFAERTGLSPSTVVRLTYTLLHLGYLRRMPDSRRYCLGPAVLTAGYPLLANLQIRQLARSLMTTLASRINGAVSLVMFDRHHMVYLETARFNHTLPTQPDIGSRLPMLTTAAGRAWLARTKDEERIAILNQIRLYEPDYYEANIAKLPRVLADFQKDGFCSNQEEWRPNTYGFAVPMSKPVDSSLLVFNCGVPMADGPFSQRATEIGPQLIALVRSLERMLEL